MRRTDEDHRASHRSPNPASVATAPSTVAFHEIAIHISKTTRANARSVRVCLIDGKELPFHPPDCSSVRHTQPLPSSTHANFLVPAAGSTPLRHAHPTTEANTTRQSTPTGLNSHSAASAANASGFVQVAVSKANRPEPHHRSRSCTAPVRFRYSPRTYGD